MMSCQLFLIFSVRAFGDAGLCARLCSEGRISAKLRDVGRFFVSMMMHHSMVFARHAMVVYDIGATHSVGGLAMVWQECSRSAVAEESVRCVSCVAQ